MLRIENVVLPSNEQWEAIIRGTRNPYDSWEKSDSYPTYDGFQIGKADEDLMKRLASAGQVHGKFLRMIPVYLDIIAPLYWWKEFDTYKVGTVCNSCSTMHRIHAKEFTMEDFSFEHCENDGIMVSVMRDIIWALNRAREQYIATKDKTFWLYMIQLLPSSYNQRRTLMVNYAVLKNIYEYRHDHKLDEWHTLCHWIDTLPLGPELIIGGQTHE